MKHEVLTLPQDDTVEACWKSIGIYGAKDCPELVAHSHCRNCPEFSRQAALLLDRDMPAGALIDAALPPAPEPGEPTQSLMVLRLGAEWFAFPTLALDEIASARPIHSLPHRRNPALLGLVNVRGELIVCVSLATLVQGEGATRPDRGGMIMVARHAGGRFAFPVDEVAQTIHCAPGDQMAVPATLARSAAAHTRGVVTWRDRPVGWLDEAALFASFERCLD